MRHCKGPKVMEGTQIGTLHKLSINPLSPASVEQVPSIALAITSDYDANLVLRHKSMGHVNVQVLKHTSTRNSLKDFTISSHSKLPCVC